MKRFILIGVISVFSCMLLALPASAQILGERFYFKADAGANWVMDTDLKEFIGADTPGMKVEFDPGPRVGLGFGYHLTEWFAAEAELGFMANSLKRISGATRTDAVFGQAPFLVNARLEIPTSCRFSPYLGIGGGGSAMYLDIDEIEIDGAGVWGTGSSLVWAYQAFAGIRYRISDAVDLSLEYRFFGAGDPNFEEEDHHHYYQQRDSIRFGRIEGHAVSLAVNLRF